MFSDFKSLNKVVLEVEYKRLLKAYTKPLLYWCNVASHPTLIIVKSKAKEKKAMDSTEDASWAISFNAPQ